VILLDEPTNDLDVETLRTLEEASRTRRACVMVSSHDRWFSRSNGHRTFSPSR